MRAFAILPAAGRSRRMGEPKLLLPWGKTSILRHVVGQWLASSIDAVIVVLHPEDEALASEATGAHVVRPEPPPAEMKDSIRYGLEAARCDLQCGPGDVWLVAPADMPNLRPEAIDRLLAAYRERGNSADGEPRIWAASHGGRRGHPVLFPWELASEVAELASHEGLNVLLSRHPVNLVEVGDASIFVDVDTPEEYNARRPRD